MKQDVGDGNYHRRQRGRHLHYNVLAISIFDWGDSLTHSWSNGLPKSVPPKQAGQSLRKNWWQEP